MLTNVASTSIDARNSLSPDSKNGQYAVILEILRKTPDGTTRKRIAVETERNPSYKKIEHSTVCARVNELVKRGQLSDGPDTRLIKQVSRISSKVVRLNEQRLRVIK